MSAFHDKTGLRFGRLVVLEPQGRDRWRNVVYLCLCDCAETTLVPSQRLKIGDTKSCGCLRREMATKHGQARTRTYKTWAAMLDRCCNPRCKAYKHYGGRGIGIDDQNWFSFRNFFDEMGEQPPGHDLHRIENDKGYSKANCVWLPHAEHMRLHADQRRRNLSLAS